jgi:hypothetical protein
MFATSLSRISSKVKQTYPATGRGGPRGSGYVKAPDLLDFQHYKGGTSSAKTPAAFTPEKIPGTHFQELSQPQGTWFCRKEARKKSSVTPPAIDPWTVRLVAQRLNHYATPGFLSRILLIIFVLLCIDYSSLWTHFSVTVQFYFLRIHRTS